MIKYLAVILPIAVHVVILWGIVAKKLKFDYAPICTPATFYINGYTASVRAAYIPPLDIIIRNSCNDIRYFYIMAFPCPLLT
jgi:hypothetical protein